MILSYVKLIGVPVSELKTQTMLARIADLIYDNSNAAIAGIVVNVGGGFFRKQKVISSVDIVKLYREGLIVRDDEVVSEFADLVRLKKLADDGYFGLGQKVVSTSGQNLGKVFDILIDSETITIQKLHIRNMFSEKLIPASKIVSWDGKVITVKTNKESVPAPSQLEISSTE